jgi:hypothetical protein
MGQVTGERRQIERNGVCLPTEKIVDAGSLVLKFINGVSQT